MTNYPDIHIKRNLSDWEVVEDCFVGEDVIIPKGFVTDLVSSGRFIWFIIPPHGDAANPSIVHDYLCRNKIYNRKKCDIIFLELMSNIQEWQRLLMYIYVRAFGWIKYYN